MYVWEDNLVICIELLELITNENCTHSSSFIEGISRVIISKSYYACFNKIVELNEFYLQGENFSGTSNHINTIDSVNSYPTEEGYNLQLKSKISRTMRELEENRTKADYELGGSHLYHLKSVERHLNQAKNIFDILQHPKNHNGK